MAETQAVTEELIMALPWHAPDTPSSQILRLAYVGIDEDVSGKLEDIAAKTLFVQFHSARGPSIYLYRDVAFEDYLAVKTGGESGSAGRTFNASIKGSYEFARVEIAEGTPWITGLSEFDPES